MPSTTVGLPRLLTRVRPPRNRRDIAGTRRVRPGRLARAAWHPVGRRVRHRLGPEGAAAAAGAVILAVASVLSWLPGLPARGAVAGAVGGPAEQPELTAIEAPAADVGSTAIYRQLRAARAQEAAAPQADFNRPAEPTADLDLRPIAPQGAAPAPTEPASPTVLGGSFLADGTIVKPVTVDATVADGKHLIRIHRIERGDSLSTIADRYNVSIMTIWWANDLRSFNLLVGKTLAIPPVDGLVVKVEEGDSLYSLSKEHDVEAPEIVKVNELEDDVLVPGQVLTLPGAAGDPIPEPEPPPAGTDSGGGGDAGSAPVREPAQYSGGAMVWPVVGGNNFVSRGFTGGHQGLDIAGDHGARVVAAAGGTVIFAGWKSNGGGYQVWIAHGSGVYTTYNHLSAVSVGTGQGVGAGQMVGRLGSSGNSTGPHLHFEVWSGAIWSGGARLNPAGRL